jgi:hypothetical protein
MPSFAWASIRTRHGIVMSCLRQQQLFSLPMDLTVNAPPWDFGKLLGLCVVFFFVIAQLTRRRQKAKPEGAERPFA